MVNCRGKRLLIVAALVLAVNLSSAGPLGAYLTAEEETELGEQFLASIKSQYELVDYPYLNQYINDLGTHIGRHIEVPYFSLNFYVVNEHIINAFAAPGGHVFIFSDLVIMLDDIDELACILAHELGHVSARHLAARIERSKRIGMATMAGVLAGILVGGKAAEPLVTGSLAAGVQAELGYSREDERQADQIGFRLADTSGFDPSGMVTVLKKIQREHWYGGNGIPPYLQTHPGAPERMANIEAMLQGYGKKPDHDRTKQLRSRFPLFQIMVTALCMEEEDATREFTKRLHREPKSALALYGLGLVHQRAGRISEAIDYFHRSLRENPDSIEVMFSMGDAYLTKGQYEESLSILEKALTLAPRDKEILYLYALSLQNQERYNGAAKIYERLTFLPPVKDRVYYNLGLTYGRQGKLALAHYNLGIYFAKLRKTTQALFHFKKAEQLAAEKPALKEKIRNALKDLK
ncbi:MAG: M48 family metalloprotease [Deltaproteobacteria bacterium]|nr:M48 family metalloprotease [Deltaproteobacteria bacterium]